MGCETHSSYNFRCDVLDLYFIDDHQPKSAISVRELKRAGGMEEVLFNRLQEQRIIEPWLDYYSGFRWGSENVAQLLSKLNQRSSSLQEDERVFMTMLQRAASAQKSLLAFGD